MGSLERVKNKPVRYLVHTFDGNIKEVYIILVDQVSSKTGQSSS
jgi:hypothetical protein